jgi:hypothetical protein
MSFDLSDLVGSVEAPDEDGPKRKYLVVSAPATSSAELDRRARIEADTMRKGLPMVFIGEDGVTLENPKQFPPAIDTPAKAIEWVATQRRNVTWQQKRKS